MKISDIDKNLALNLNTSDDKTVFMDVLDEPFEICGVLTPTEKEPYYRRMPQELADRVSPGVADLNHHTAGGHVRFRSNSSYVSLHAVQSSICLMTHMTVCGIGGFDTCLHNVKCHIGGIQTDLQEFTDFIGAVAEDNRAADTCAVAFDLCADGEVNDFPALNFTHGGTADCLI